MIKQLKYKYMDSITKSSSSSAETSPKAEAKTVVETCPFLKFISD